MTNDTQKAQIKSFIEDNIVNRNTTAFASAGPLNPEYVEYVAETVLNVEAGDTMDVAL